METPSSDRPNTITGIISQLFLSLAIGSGMAAVFAAQDMILWPFKPIKEGLSDVFHVDSSLSVASGGALWITGGLYAACLFTLLRFLARTPLSRTVSRCSQFLSLTIPALTWFLVASGIPPVAYVLLVIETVICSFGVFYLPRRHEGSGWYLALIVVIHFVLWTWLFWRRVPASAATFIPIVGALSCYLALFRKRSAKPGLAVVEGENKLES